MTSKDKNHFPNFPTSFRGELVTANHEKYKQVRLLFNMRSQETPALIARCLDADDVATVMQYASKNKIPVAVRSGGHSVDATAMPEGALVVDLSLMKKITVDPSTSKATVESGVLLGEMDIATQEYGLVIPAGTVSTTGVAGLTLGGGIGYNMRRLGATVDSLLSCEMVTVDGRKVKASKDENPELFWALRGGGGNFGIVTKFEFQAHKVGPQVTSGLLIYPVEVASQIATGVRDFMKSAPRELFVGLGLVPCPPLPMVPPQAHGKPICTVLVVYTGDQSKAQEVIAPLLQFGAPLVNLIKPSTWVETNRMLDAAAPYGMKVKALGGYLTELTDEAFDVVVKNALKSPVPEHPGALTVQNLWYMSGAITEDFSEDSTAFSREGAKWSWEAISMWNTESEETLLESWLDNLHSDLKPHLRSNAYINLTCDQGDEWFKGVYGSREKFERLLSVKRTWDPNNLLRYNKNLKA